MSLLTAKIQFLYPFEKRFLFDEIAEKIVRALEKRNWSVPGIVLGIDTYGSGEAKYQLLRELRGENFGLYFSRRQRRLTAKWNDTAGVSKIFIPKQGIEVWSDDSPVEYYLYVGENWEKDREWFMQPYTKGNSKLKGEPRRYLKYVGKRRKGEKLIHSDDFGCEYSPIGNEPTVIDFLEKTQEITAWMQEFILDYIESYPEAAEIQSPVPTEEIIPYQGPWNAIYSVCNSEDAARLMQGKKNPNELQPEDRHASFGFMPRWITLDWPCRGRFPEVARDGFIWCDVNPQDGEPDISRFVNDVWRRMKSSFSNYLVEIRLKFANDVYVADSMAFTRKREEILAANYPRDHLTKEEVYEAIVAEGLSVVPITEYKGDYTRPVVLIRRELEFDEIASVVKIEKKKKAD